MKVLTDTNAAVTYISGRDDPFAAEIEQMMCALKDRHAIEKEDFRDFEDALQDCCAAESGADYIVTANKRDFAGHSTVYPLTPKELLSLFGTSAD